MGRLSNETRFGIITDYFVFGMKQIDIALKYGCTQASVYSVTTMFNLVKEEQYAELKACALSRRWGIEGIKWAFNALGKIPPMGFINDLEKSLKAKRAGQQTAPEPKEEHKAEPDTNLVEVVAPEEPPNQHSCTNCGNRVADPNQGETRPTYHDGLFQRRCRL